MTIQSRFVQEIGEIYRLKIPFEDIYTSVFFVRVGDENTLIDCATTHCDVDLIIEPALKSLGFTFSDIDRVVVTHEHGDHVGGLPRILQKNPEIQVVKTVEKINGLEIYPLCGHTENFIGVLCLESGTLISGDGLQGEGIGKYRCGLQNKNGYLLSIERIARDERINNLLFSHAFEPWNKDGAFGRKNVEKILSDCKDYVFRSFKN